MQTVKQPITPHYYDRSPSIPPGYQSAAVAGKTATELFGVTEGAAIDQFLNRCITAKTALTEAENLTFDG